MRKNKKIIVDCKKCIHDGVPGASYDMDACYGCGRDFITTLRNNFRLKDWWDLTKCFDGVKSCCLFIDMGSDSIDAYKGCAKSGVVDYRLEKCPLSERLYKELNDE